MSDISRHISPVYWAMHLNISPPSLVWKVLGYIPHKIHFSPRFRLKHDPSTHLILHEGGWAGDPVYISPLGLIQSPKQVLGLARTSSSGMSSMASCCLPQLLETFEEFDLLPELLYWFAWLWLAPFLWLPSCSSQISRCTLKIREVLSYPPSAGYFY
jgi:hypothetical protein